MAGVPNHMDFDALGYRLGPIELGCHTLCAAATTLPVESMYIAVETRQATCQIDESQRFLQTRRVMAPFLLEHLVNGLRQRSAFFAQQVAKERRGRP